MFNSKKKESFKVNFETTQTHETAKTVSTFLGRAPTTIATATTYNKRKSRKNPKNFIKASEKNYYGQIFEDNEQPFYLDKSEITHTLTSGTTGSGKGCLLQSRVFQSIIENKGIIIVDPKGDDYLPQVIKETLISQNRPKSDFQMIYFPNKWGYKAITDDTYLEIANKLIDMFDFTPSSNPGVDYYRRNGRTLLRRLLKMFFVENTFNVYIKKSFEDLKKHIILLKEDLEKREMYEKEIGKNRPRAELLEKYSKRFFEPELLDKIYFAKSDIDTLDNLATKLIEVTEGITMQDDIDISSALHDNKIIYFKVDMNDIASLNWIKYLLVDIIQKSKKKIANTDIFLDEVSFYATKTLSSALATVRSMGLNFTLILQALSQFPDEIRDDIIENCNLKIFYKTSNLTTLNYLKEIGGLEAVTKTNIATNQHSYSQDFEEFLNTTKIRALPRTLVAIIVAESLPYPQLINTNFIETTQKFDYSKYRNFGKKDAYAKINLAKRDTLTVDKKRDKSELDRYKVYLKDSPLLLENSDLMGISLGSEKIR
jgi:hypothetical protein